MIIKIEVTQRDIDNGKRNACQSCPVALALKRATSADFVAVHADIAKFNRAGKFYRTHLPIYVKNWIYNFDSGPRVSVKPITIELEFREV